MSASDQLLPARQRAAVESIEQTLRFLKRASQDNDPLKAIGFLEQRHLLQAELERVRAQGRAVLKQENPEAALAGARSAR